MKTRKMWAEAIALGTRRRMLMSEKRKAVYWGAPDEERLIHDDMDEAIEAIFDEWPDPLTGMVTVCGYARMEVSAHYLDAESILEDILERLDEEYGNPDGDRSEATPPMLDAAKALVAAIKAEYVPWACEEVERHEIDMAAWIREHRPDWLEGPQGGPPCLT